MAASPTRWCSATSRRGRTCAGCRAIALPSLEALRELSLATARIVNPEVRGGRRRDQHRRAAGGRGARLPGRGRGADGAADGRSVPAGRRRGWWTRCREGSTVERAEALSAGAGLHHQPRLAHRGAGADGDGRGGRRCAGAASACPTPATARRPRASRRRSRGCRRRSTGSALQRAAAAGGGAQRGRLRALGSRGEAQPGGGSGSSPGCRSRGRWSPPTRCRSTRPRRCGRRRRRTPAGRS